jgi:ectoine hydroxylase-related dioxygenase (phytanoyl-CoA dioxygenase family)
MAGVAAWVALDDVDESNGCMSMVPGSHLWGNAMPVLSKLPTLDALPAEYEGHSVKTQFCPVKKGEVHFHHALTWHSSPANTSDRPRRAIAYHYMPPDTRYVAGGQHVMKPYISVADGDTLHGEYFPIVYP